jgi:hypothetical protein
MQALQDYGMGKGSLADALKSAGQAAKGAGSAASAKQKQAIMDRYAGAKQAAESNAQMNFAMAELAKMNAGNPVFAGMKSSAGPGWGAGNKDYDAMQKELAGVQDEGGAAQASISDLLTTNPIAAQRYLTDTIQEGPDTARLFGKGGEMDKSIAATDEFMGQGREADKYAGEIAQGEKDLASRGYSLKPEDYEAYGQMSDELARSFGGQEKGAAAALAARGLGATSSGNAGTLFSGIQGNKAEQLAGAQRKVANDRMNMNLQRLQAQRSFLGQQQNAANAKYGLAQGSRGQTTALGGLQEQAKSDLFNRSMGGRQQTAAEMEAAAGKQLQQQGMNQQQVNTQFEQNEATRPPSFGEVLGNVAGGALGLGVGAATGGLGAGIGKAAGSLFTSKK